jgi:biopolymer transport protein ExbB
VMFGLVLASLMTWTVWLAKTIELHRETSFATRRLRLLERGITLTEIENESGAKDGVAQVVRSAAREAALSGGTIGDGFKERIALRLERVEAAMARRIARGTGMLATIGATAPFVGLFGTVWGIMNSFSAIAARHDTTLAVVAPGIAEALFATAMGLLAAIPAVIFYNRFVNEIGRYNTRLDAFADEFSAILSRQLDEKVR